MKVEVYKSLEAIKNTINKTYGFIGKIPSINYGPCGVFANVFYDEWNKRFLEKVHICFIMTNDLKECDHICISLPSGELYDGGIGIHPREHYNDFIIVDMMTYDYEKLDKWAYGLDRVYPRYCPSFDKSFVQKVISVPFERFLNETSL